MKTGRKKTLFFAAVTVLFLSIASATNLENIEDITALNSVIDIQDNVNMQGNRINNIANPNSGDDALPRSYADGRYLRRDGNNYMTGNLDMNGNNMLDPSAIKFYNSGASGLGTVAGGLESSDSAALVGNHTGSQDSSLRLYMGDDAGSDSFQMWSASCAWSCNDYTQARKQLEIGLAGSNPGEMEFTRTYIDLQNHRIENVNWANSDQPPGSTDDQTLGTSGNQITIENGNQITAPYANDADQLDGVQLGNINWGDTAMSQSDVGPADVSLAALSAGSGISGNNYDGTTGRTWSVNWGAANDLNSNGGISDFSNANDLDGNGNLASGSVSDNEIVDNTVDNSEIQNGDNFDFGSTDVNGVLDVHHGSNVNGLRLINKVNDPDSPAPLLIATDDDGEDLAIEVRSDSDGTSVNTSQNYQDTADTSFKVWSDGRMDVANPSSTGRLLDIGGDANFDGQIDLNSNTLRDVGNIVDDSGTSCGANEFLNGNGNCEVDTDTDTTIPDNQNLGTSGNQITLDNGGSVTAPYANNADKLDGEQLQDVLNDENSDVASTDWNTLTEPAIYGVSAPSGEDLKSSNNQPSSAYDYGHLIVTEGGGSGGIMQMYVSHHSANNGAFWVRTGWSDGDWDPWHALPTREWVNSNDAYQDGDTSSTNELQDLEDVRSRDNVVSGGINFQSSGSISSLENLNVDSINSNKGSDPVDMDQGIDLDGSEIIDDSGSLTLGGGDVDIPDGNLRLQRTGNSWVSIDAGDNQWDYDGFRIRTTDENGNFETKMDITTGMSSSGADTARINFRNNDEYQFSDGRVLISDGQLNMGGNNINNIGGLQNCGANEFVNGNGNCETDTDTDTTIADNQNLGYSNDNAPTGSYATHTVTIDNGNNAQIRDYYDPDNTIPDDQNIQASATGDTIDISIDNGNGASATIDDDDASTRCSGNEVLMGDGTCGVPSTNPSLSDVVSNGNSINNGQTVDTSSGTFRLPVGTNQY